jgi:hypothetical protein
MKNKKLKGAVVILVAALAVFALSTVACSKSSGNGGVNASDDGSSDVGVSGGNGVEARNINSAQNHVFGYMGATGVVVGNSVKFFVMDNGWTEIPEAEFALPDGYKSVFGYMGATCVVVGNSVKFFEMDSNGWTEYPMMELTLPNGYKSVFGYRGITGVVVGNSVKFFGIDSNGWTEYPIMEFTLP